MTKNDTDFSQYLHETELSTSTIVPIQGLNQGKHQKVDDSIHTETHLILKCPQCDLSDYKKNGKIKGSNRQRYKCNHCSKSFSLSAEVVNIELLFQHVYDAQHAEQPYMLKTKYRKENTSKQDKKYMRFFNRRLQELEFENRHTYKETIELAFKETNLYFDKQEAELLSKQKDTFFFFLNYPQADIAYDSEFQHFRLVRNHDINNYQQDHNSPLFYCNCGSTNLRRYGTNNNGRSRLRCRECKSIFVIRLKNLIPKDYFISTFIDMFNQAIPHYLLVDELAEQMYHDFFNTQFYNYFEELLYHTNLITHMVKYYIMKLFILMQHMRYNYHMLKHANRYSQCNTRTITNLKYFSITKDLSFLKYDGSTIEQVLKSHKECEAMVPELFDEDLLLSQAVENSIDRAKVTKLQSNK